MSELEITYQEFSLEDVIRYFVKGFEIPIKDWQFFIDPVKNKVILRLYIEKRSK